ncbi:hypothetical protein H5410_057340, partial [Solanum commersonii]
EVRPLLLHLLALIIHDSPVLGFGFDPLTNDYKVIMSPKAKNVANSSRCRKGEASRLKNWERIQKFGKKAVERYGWEWFEC